MVKRIQMAKIIVHLLNFHGIYSHIEILLENISESPHQFYPLDRWTKPWKTWHRYEPRWVSGLTIMETASSIFSFVIEADPEEIAREWKQFWDSSQDIIFTRNCADATQWFLKNYANIPNPNLSNLSLNHFILGIPWPSFIPCPITLPGRVMSNAKFYIKAREHPEIAEQYSYLFLHTSLALSALSFSMAIVGITLSMMFLTSAFVVMPLSFCALTTVGSTYAFFKSYHLLSAKNLVEEDLNVELDSELKATFF